MTVDGAIVSVVSFCVWGCCGWKGTDAPLKKNAAAKIKNNTPKKIKAKTKNRFVKKEKFPAILGKEELR